MLHRSAISHEIFPEPFSLSAEFPLTNPLSPGYNDGEGMVSLMRPISDIRDPVFFRSIRRTAAVFSFFPHGILCRQRAVPFPSASPCRALPTNGLFRAARLFRAAGSIPNAPFSCSPPFPQNQSGLFPRQASFFCVFPLPDDNRPL